MNASPDKRLSANSMDDVSHEKLLDHQFPNRATQWQLRTRTLSLGRRPLIMGIVNVTPDSFSDGGKFLAAEQAIQQALQLAQEGADILDIGGESTRPDASVVQQDEELRRIQPVVKAVCEQTDVPVSIDTTKAVVAEAAIEAGAEIINDVSGLEADQRMIEVAVKTNAGVCAMHMLGNPRTMQNNPNYEDVVQEIYQYLQQRFDVLRDAGIKPERICLDPGIGFGKTHQHNLTLLAACGRFHNLGQPLLVGHSRKGFLAKIIKDKTTDRTAATVGVAASLASLGVQVIRVHDVRPVREALDAFVAAGGVDGVAGRIES